MMESLVTLMIVFVCLDFVVRLSFLRPVYVIGAAAACALFIGLMCPVATAQSSTSLSGLISDPALMLDVAVILSVDVMLGITFCWLSVGSLDCGGETGFWHRFMTCLTGYFPGLMIFIVLFYLLVKVIFAFPGVSFHLLSWGLAAVVLLAVPLLVFIVRRILPRVRGRLDLMFMAYVITAMIGVVATA